VINVTREQMAAFTTRILDQFLKRGSRRAIRKKWWTPQNANSLTLTDVEQPIHKLKISRSFEIGKYEITQTQWEAVTGNRPNDLSAYWEYFTGANFPVEDISWQDVQEFLNKLNAKNDSYLYRLPTEAEWEYAGRAGTADYYNDYAGNLSEMGWYNGNSSVRRHSIGLKKPKGFGLYDMPGNVWEWCSD
jgi:formylglycine-generating enzyme required for sulfatase activity